MRINEIKAARQRGASKVQASVSKCKHLPTPQKQYLQPKYPIFTRNCKQASSFPYVSLLEGIKEEKKREKEKGERVGKMLDLLVCLHPNLCESVEKTTRLGLSNKPGLKDKLE